MGVRCDGCTTLVTKLRVSCPAACVKLSKHSETRNSMGKSRYRTAGWYVSGRECSSGVIPGWIRMDSAPNGSSGLFRPAAQAVHISPTLIRNSLGGSGSFHDCLRLGHGLNDIKHVYLRRLSTVTTSFQLLYVLESMLGLYKAQGSRPYIPRCRHMMSQVYDHVRIGGLRFVHCIRNFDSRAR